MLSLFDHTLREQATQFLNLFLAAPELSAGFSLNESRRVSVAGESTPALSNGASLMNNDATLPDQFTARTGAPVTLFARDGQDFVRVTTSLKKADGEHAVGTKLNRNSRSYAQIMAGKPYTGIAKLFGTSHNALSAHSQRRWRHHRRLLHRHRYHRTTGPATRQDPCNDRWRQRLHHAHRRGRKTTRNRFGWRPVRRPVVNGHRNGSGRTRLHGVVRHRVRAHGIHARGQRERRCHHLLHRLSGLELDHSQHRIHR